MSDEKTLEEEKFEFEKKAKLVDWRNQFFSIFATQIFVYNTSIVGLNLYIMKDFMEKLPTFNVLLILIAVISGVLSAVLLLYAYSITYPQFDMSQESANKLDKKAMYFEKWAWRLFCTGVGSSLLNIIIIIFSHLIIRLFPPIYYSQINFIL